MSCPWRSKSARGHAQSWATSTPRSAAGHTQKPQDHKKKPSAATSCCGHCCGPVLVLWVILNGKVGYHTLTSTQVSANECPLAVGHRLEKRSNGLWHCLRANFEPRGTHSLILAVSLNTYAGKMFKWVLPRRACHKLPWRLAHGRVARFGLPKSKAGFHSLSAHTSLATQVTQHD